MTAIDLNADMGEYSDEDGRQNEAALAPFITSCSIACGGHAGDEETMRATARLAKAHDVRTGAHPSYPDRQGFGRKSISISAEDLARAIEQQVAALKTVLEAENMRLNHFKPHGALYNDAAKTPALAQIVAQAARQAGEDVILLGPLGSGLETAAKTCGVPFAAEGFVDRLYRRDGSLTPRSEPGAIIEDIAARAEQALAIATSGPVTAADGELSIRAATLCIHSDSPGAVETARAVRAALAGAGVTVQALQ